MKRQAEASLDSDSPYKKQEEEENALPSHHILPCMSRNMWEVVIGYMRRPHVWNPANVRQTRIDVLRTPIWHGRKFIRCGYLLANLMALRLTHPALTQLLPMERVLTMVKLSMTYCHLPRSRYWDGLFDRWFDAYISATPYISSKKVGKLLDLVIIRKTGRLEHQIRTLLIDRITPPYAYPVDYYTRTCIYAIFNCSIPAFIAVMAAIHLHNFPELHALKIARLLHSDPDKYRHVPNDVRAHMLRIAIDYDCAHFDDEFLKKEAMDMLPIAELLFAPHAGKVLLHVGDAPLPVGDVPLPQPHPHLPPPGRIHYTMRVFCVLETGHDPITPP